MAIFWCPEKKTPSVQSHQTPENGQPEASKHVAKERVYLMCLLPSAWNLFRWAEFRINYRLTIVPYNNRRLLRSLQVRSSCFTHPYTGWSKSLCAPDDCTVIVRCTETFWSLSIMTLILNITSCELDVRVSVLLGTIVNDDQQDATM